MDSFQHGFKPGVVLGYAFSYFLFTTILFFVLTLTHRLPASWTYLCVALVTVSIVIVGRFLKWVLS
jgi:hypothetical protein